MTDLYAKCPCGSGKKIKFCCRDIITDIEKIERMLRGEQRNAAAEKINKLLEKHPGRPALLSLKALVSFDQDHIEEAESVVSALLQAEPDNTSGLALQAILMVMRHETKLALAALHKSLRLSEGVMTQIVYRAFYSVCVHLIQRGQVVAAYAHLMTLVSITNGEDETSLALLYRLTSSYSLPAVFYSVIPSTIAPEDASWKREFDFAMEHYYQGNWTGAAELFKDMNRRILDEPILLRNQAILNIWTGDTDDGIKAFHTYAKIREVDEDAAVEAEACAQVLEMTHDEDLLEVVELAVEIDDASQVMESLLSSPNVQSVNSDFTQGFDGPPPKGVFTFYDRDLPTGDVAELDLQSLPKVRGTIFVYGKETDRPARLQVISPRDSRFLELLASLNEALNVSISEDSGEIEVVSHVHKIQRILQPQFWVPVGTSVQQMQQYQEAWHQHQIYEVLPELTFSRFGDKTLREAAQDRKQRRKVLGLILNLELALEYEPYSVDFNRLRRDLGVPEAEPIDPKSVEITRLSMSQLARLELSKLAAPELCKLFEIVVVRPNGKTFHRIGLEILRRGEEIEGLVDLVDVRARLAESAPTSDECLEHLAAGRDLAVANGGSPASWLISELEHRLQRGEVDIAQRLVTEIQTRYIQQPGVAQILREVLAKFGLLPARPHSARNTSARTHVPAEVGAAAATQESPGVWTPDDTSTPNSTDGGDTGESKIWMPDMD